jgi:hypothetical protein
LYNTTLYKLLDAKLSVASIEKKPSKRSPKPPFITSTLQQEASQKLGFSFYFNEFPCSIDQICLNLIGVFTGMVDNFPFPFYH